LAADDVSRAGTVPGAEVVAKTEATAADRRLEEDTDA